MEQIEFCDVLVTDACDDANRISEITATLNPRAHRLVAAHGDVPLEDVLDTGRFDSDVTAGAPGWLAILEGEAPSIDADEASEIGHFVYRAQAVSSRTAVGADASGVNERHSRERILLARHARRSARLAFAGRRHHGASRTGGRLVGGTGSQRMPDQRSRTRSGDRRGMVQRPGRQQRRRPASGTGADRRAPRRKRVAVTLRRMPAKRRGMVARRGSVASLRRSIPHVGYRGTRSRRRSRSRPDCGCNDHDHWPASTRAIHFNGGRKNRPVADHVQGPFPRMRRNPIDWRRATKRWRAIGRMLSAC